MEKKLWEVTTLKALLLIYITLCLIIASLNYGLRSSVSEETHQLITKIWQFYENQFKTFLIIIGSWLTIRITGKRSKMQKKNLIGFICAALFIHIFGPILTSNNDLYFFSMPLPWSTTALQLMAEESNFYIQHVPLWGLSGISAVLFIYLIITIIVFSGTLIYGRRWQCSTLCLFNGFIAEAFSPAFPILKRKKNNKAKTIPFLEILKWFLLTVNIFFIIFWIYSIISKDFNYPIATILAKIEVYKYLSMELLMAMFLWVIFTGRGYCYYCPLGTVLSGISRIAGQKITTDKAECINCKKCDLVCPMNIIISVSAMKKKDVIDSRCVGCGHCVDICPVNTLEYSTKFLDKITRI